MSKVISVELSNKSIDKAIADLRKYKTWVAEKEQELRSRLAEIGKEVAEMRFSAAIYDGTNDVQVEVSDDGNTAVITASGTSVVFIEFGSGVTYGYGHPLASKNNFEPGSWSEGEKGKGHWDNPDGWYYKHGEKSLGNPPSMAMYNAVQRLSEQLTQIAREVFSQ